MKRAHIALALLLALVVLMTAAPSVAAEVPATVTDDPISPVDITPPITFLTLLSTPAAEAHEDSMWYRGCGLGGTEHYCPPMDSQEDCENCCWLSGYNCLQGCGSWDTVCNRSCSQCSNTCIADCGEVAWDD